MKRNDRSTFSLARVQKIGGRVDRLDLPVVPTESFVLLTSGYRDHYQVATL